MKYKKYLLIFMIIILMFPIIAEANDIEEDYEKIKEIGELIGYYDGLMYDNVPSLNDVIEKYETYFSYKDDKYRDYFIQGYYEGFKKSYEQRISNSIVDEIEPVEYADILGLILGELYGNRDYYNGKKYDPNSSIPTDKTIIYKYNLNNLSYGDRLTFLTTFKEQFELGYREGYMKGNFEHIENSYENGIVDGEYFGNILGQAHGVKDYFRGLTRNYRRNMPTDKEIDSTYSLDKINPEYKEGFIEGFKRSYKNSYDNSYIDIKTKENITDYEEGYKTGKESGIAQGKAYATMDFYNELENDWKKHYVYSTDIIREYKLFLQSSSYRNCFISGFIEGLYEGYTDQYEELFNEFSINKVITQVIPISGGEVKSVDEILSLKVEKGTYYNPISVKIETLSHNLDMEGLIKASEVYRISISNKSKEFNENPLELKFEYYGGYNGGIYKFVNDNWLYIPSKVEGEYIKGLVSPNSIDEDGSIYGVFVDKNYKILVDIRNHWAKDEIITYQRRGIINGYSDGTFRPDNYINYGEFLLILGRVYNWNDSDIYSFQDVMEYALENGYIEDIMDKNINSPITYREVESIMRKVFNSNTFNWYNVAAKMLYDKQYKCSSYYSKDNYLTRAEAVYMLYILNEWRY